MSLIPLVLDCEVSYCRGSSKPVSLLTLPLEGKTVLDHLADRLGKVGHGEILVLSDYLQDGDLSDEGRSGPLPVTRVSSEELPRALNRYEAGDYLLVVDPRLWPVEGYDFRECQRRIEKYTGATHFVALGADSERTRERVECDGNGNVRRVQRLYAKNWSEVGGSSVTHSTAPLRSVIGLRFLFPSELRAALAAGGVLSQDVPRSCDVFRLGIEEGFLGLMERSVAQTCHASFLEGFTMRGPEVLTGARCRIHRRARLVPPIIIQPDCVIEENVTVIGPAIVGAGSRIMHGACVVQSALAKEAVVLPGVIVRQQVACGECSGESDGARAVRKHGFDAAWLNSRDSGTGGAVEWGAVRPARGRTAHFAVKRLMDAVLSALALLVLTPMLLVVALLIKMGSRGPVFFGHRREGRGGREFECWKFRTMVADADQRQRLLYKHSEVDGPQFKMTNDPRVTRVGRWLRITNVDELPQLLNVFLGHMSLVGPRPSPFRENQICVPWRRARLSVRPGITGLWQVCRGEDRVKGDFHEWIFYDMTYVRHFSIWLDLKILAATVVTLGGRWSVPLSWMLPRGLSDRECHRYPVTMT